MSNHENFTPERPRICVIDLDQKDYEALLKEQFNLFQGSFGPIITNIPNISSYNQSKIILDYSIPSNFHEYDIVILDLNREYSKEYKYTEHTVKNNRYNSIMQLKCSYPATIFDPRPLISSYLQHYIQEIQNRHFIQIVFGCENYEIEYEILKIAGTDLEELPSEKYSIYDFNNKINLASLRRGKEMSVCQVRDDLFLLLNKYIKNSQYHQTFSHPIIWEKEKGNHLDPNFIPLLTNMNDEIVSFIKCDGKLITFLFPDIKEKSSFLIDLLKNILPSIIPEVFPFSTQFKWIQTQEYFLPNYENLLAEKEKNKQDYEKKLTEIEAQILENDNKYKFLHDLITETGDGLVRAVYRFLKWLEFEKVEIKDEQAKSILEEDIQVEHEQGLLIIETKGIGGTSSDSDCSQISKIKLRRCKERKSFDVFALYIVNNQRYQAPLARKNPPFTEHQITDAQNDERGLLTTWQLFNLYHDIQNKIITKQDARAELVKFGLVEFKPRVKEKLSNPKQILKDGHVIILDINNIKLQVGQTLIAKKNNRYFRTKIVSIKIDDNSVNEVETGEIGLKLDNIISKATILWTE